MHDGADGRRYLVVHGDMFDLVVTQARWLALLGDKAYEFALTANRVFNAFRRVFGAPYWSLSKWAKLKVKNAVNYIGAFEKALATEAKHHHADGVICGHIHTAAMHDDFGLRYINCGDWVESCTAVAEHDDGQFEIITWTHAGRDSATSRLRQQRQRPRQPDVMKILVATDAWHPAGQRRRAHARATSRARRARSARSSNSSGPTSSGPLPMPSYPEIRLALVAPGDIERRIERSRPDAIHVATEGPLGHAMRRVCLRRGLPFTTSFHTRFPDYLAERLPVPERWTCEADLGLAAALSLPRARPCWRRRRLWPASSSRRGFRNVKLWPRGVDAELFRPRRGKGLDLPRPIFLTVGRWRWRKISRHFSRSICPARSWWSATGRPRSALTRQVSDSGVPRQRAPARRWRKSTPPPTCSCFRAAPTRSAWCCWRRWRAACRSRPFRRRRRATSSASAGRVLDDDLQRACLDALDCSRDDCRAFALRMTWETSARIFLHACACEAARCAAHGKPVAAWPRAITLRTKAASVSRWLLRRLSAIALLRLPLTARR